MRPKDIDALLHLSKQKVNYWIHREIRKSKKREQFNRLEINTIIKWAKDKNITFHIEK